MEGLVLGCDLCNDYCQISCWNPERGEPEAVELTQGSSMISTVICGAGEKKPGWWERRVTGAP